MSKYLGIIIGIVVATSLLFFGGSFLYKRLFTEGGNKVFVELKRLAESDSLNLDRDRVLGASLDFEIYSTVLTSEGSYSLLQLMDGKIADEKYEGLVTGRMPNGELVAYAFSDYWPEFTLANGKNSPAGVVERAITVVHLKDGHYLPIEITSGEIKSGRLTGTVEAKTLDAGHSLYLSVQNHKIAEGYLTNVSSYISSAARLSAFIVLKETELRHPSLTNLESNKSVLAAQTGSSNLNIYNFDSNTLLSNPGSGTYNVIGGVTSSGAPSNPKVVSQINQIIATTPSFSSTSLVSPSISYLLLGPGSISTAMLQDASITAAKIATGTITADKLASDVLTTSTSTISDGSVTTAKLADGAVTSSKIASNTIGTDRLSGTLTFGGSTLIDLSQVTHSSTALQGLILPNVSSSSPSNPSSGKGYLAYDTADKQVLFYNGTAWGTVGSGTITSVNAGNGLSGGGSSGAVTLSVNSTDISTCTSSSTQKIIWDSTNNRLTCGTDQTTGGSASSLSSITNALTTNTLSNGDLAQVWNWSLTTANKTAFTFGESAASTATGNPYILGISTLASSTANPLLVTAGGTSNGIKIDTNGLLQAIGTGGIKATTLNGATFAAPGAIGGTTPGSGAFTTISATGAITSTVSTGTAPLVIASTTNVANLNASSLSGATFASPGSIGSTTPGTGAFTTLSASSTLSANGGLTIAANQGLTFTSGTGTLTQNYSNTTGTQSSFNHTNSASTGTNTSTALSIAITGTANTLGSNTITGLNFPNVVAATNNTYNGVTFGTGFNNYLTSGTVNLTAAGALSGLTTLGLSGQLTSTVTTGTAPFVVASTTNVANLNASSLSGATFSAPGAIGGGTAAAGTFTTLTGNTSITDVGLSTAGVVTNTSGGLLGTLAGTTTTVLHGNAAGAPTFASITGSDLASNIAISTTGNISTTSTGTITSAGLLTASGGLTVAGGQNLTLSSGTGTITQTYSNTAGTANALNVTNSGSSGTNSVIGKTIAITGTINGTGSNTTTGINFANVAAATNNTYNGITFGTGFNNYLTSGTVNLTAAGALSGITTLDLSGAITGATTTNTINGIIINSGAVSGVSTLGLSGAISGATATNTINGLIINSGALSGISTINASGQITSTLATGTAPFVVASTTNVVNLNASSLSGATFAAPGAIGGTTPGSGAFTTLSASGLVSANGGLTLAANQNLIFTSGTGTVTQNYSNTTGTQTVLNHTNSGSSGTNTSTVLGLAITGTANGTGSNTITGINFPNVAAATNNTYYGLVFGTGLTDILRYNGTQLIAGTGVLQSAGISGSYGSLTGTGALTSGSIASGFGTIATGNTITGTTLNGTTGINTGASAGTQRIDATGNLLNIGNVTGTGAITVNTTGNANGVTINTAAGASGNSGAITIQSGGTTTSGTSGNITIDVGAGATSNGTIGIGTANSGTITIGRSTQGITLPGFTGNNAVLYGTTSTGVLAAATTSTSGLCLLSGAATGYVPAWTTCPGGGGSWSQLTAPSADLSLAMAANHTTFTWGGNTGAGLDMFKLTDNATNTGTGYILDVAQVAGSAAKPLKVTQGANTLIDTTSGGALTLTSIGAATWGTTTGNLTLQIAGTGTTGNVQVGAGGGGSATPDFLVVDQATGALPAGTNGAVVLDSTGKFNIYEGAWKVLCNKTDLGCGTGSGAALSAITAATAGNTINSGDNAQVWNWSLTTASKTALSFGENVASTATGAPYIVGISTLATSTANPLIVTAGGTANGIKIDTTGLLQAIGTGGIKATDLVAGTYANALTLSSATNSITVGTLTATGGTINGVNIGATTPGTGKFTTLTSTGATDLANAGASNVTIATTGTGTVAIGNATGTFALTSSGGLNVTTGGALTGVASVDTIAHSATAITFAGAGTLASTGANALTLTGGAASTWSIGSGNALTLTSSSIQVSSAGVLSIPGANATADITSITAGNALTVQPLVLGTASGTGGALSLKGGNESGTTSTGGGVTIDAGTGTSTNGSITIGGTNASALTIGRSAVTTTVAGTLSSSGGISLAANQGITFVSGTGTLTQNYSNTTGTETTFNHTNSASSGTNTSTVLSLAITGTANAAGSNTITGLNFPNVAAATNNTYNGITFGTGFNNFLTSGTINLTAAGAASGLTTLGLSGAITGATATNTINGIIINSGAVSGVSTLGLSGAISGATATNTINGIVINSGAVSSVTTLGASSTVTIGSGGNTYTLNPAGTSGITYAGTVRPTRQVTLSPEYPGAVLTASGSSNTGTMTSDFCAASAGVGGLTATNATVCNTSGDTHNYYQWTTTQATAQTYDIWVKWRVPDNFPSDGFSAVSNPIMVYGKRSTVNDGVTVSVYDTANALENTGGTQVAGTAWTQTSVKTTFAGTYTAGSYMTIQIRMNANASGDLVQVGEIGINYKSTN